MAYKTRLLETSDKEAWRGLLENMEQKDPHYLPEYLHIYESLAEGECRQNFGGQGLLFTYGDEQNYILYPFMKRPICGDAFTDKSGLYDIISPYGYGGPLACLKDEAVADELWSGFFAALHKYCVESGIVSEFCRLHPLFENHRQVERYSDGETKKLARIVYIDLKRSGEEIYSGLSHVRRKNLRKTMRHPDVEYSSEVRENAASIFHRIYTDTMERVAAKPKYFFPLTFIEDALNTLEDNTRFAYATYEGEVISASILLRYGQLSYFWLGASDSEFRHLPVGTLLHYQAALEEKEKGFDSIVMGGGVSGEDSLFQFKATFSNATKDFYIYEKIHMEKEYKELVEMRRQHYGTVEEDFFPRYRLP